MDYSNLATIYDETAPYYDKVYSRNSCVLENAQIIQALRNKSLDVLHYKILDLACGTGLLLDLVPFIDPSNYYGFDLSQKLLEKAREKHPKHRFIQKDIQNIGKDLSKIKPSLVTCFFSIHHLNDPIAFFITLRNKTPDTCRFVFTINLARSKQKKTIVTGKVDPSNQYLFSPLQWHQILTQCGFKIEQSKLMTISSFLLDNLPKPLASLWFKFELLFQFIPSLYNYQLLIFSKIEEKNNGKNLSN